MKTKPDICPRCALLCWHHHDGDKNWLWCARCNWTSMVWRRITTP